jgi:hypothetical protein
VSASTKLRARVSDIRYESQSAAISVGATATAISARTTGDFLIPHSPDSSFGRL